MMLINPYAFGGAQINYPFVVGVNKLPTSAVATSLGWPAGHAAGDLAILVIETANQAMTTPSGWTVMPDSPQFTGTAAAAGGVRLSAYYRVATSGAMPNATIADSGDHQTGFLIAFRNVNATTPVHATAGGVQATAATSYTLPSVTTTVDACLILHAVATDYDGPSTAVFSGWANVNLSNITERADYSGSSSAGGGYGAATGKMATAGATGTTSVTSAFNVVAAYMTIAIAPL